MLTEGINYLYFKPGNLSLAFSPSCWFRPLPSCRPLFSMFCPLVPPSQPFLLFVIVILSFPVLFLLPHPSSCSLCHPSSRCPPARLSPLLALILLLGNRWERDNVQVLPWLEANCSLAVARIQAGEEAVHRSKENRRLRYQGLPRNIHRYTTCQCCGSGIFLSRIVIFSNFRSQIQDPGANNKRGGGKKQLSYLFLQPKFHKIVNCFIFQKQIWANWQRNIVLFTKQIVAKLSKLWVGDPGKTYPASRIQG